MAVAEVAVDGVVVSLQPRLRNLACATCLAFLACGSEPTAPTLSELSVEPTSVAAGGTLTIIVSYSDEDGDLIGGRAEVATRLFSEPAGNVYAADLEGEDSTRGKLVLGVTLPSGALPGDYELGLTAIDRAGRRSSPLVSMFTVQ